MFSPLLIPILLKRNQISADTISERIKTGLLNSRSSVVVFVVVFFFVVCLFLFL